GRRPALRRHQRVHQEHPRQRRRRGPALPGENDRGGEGPRFIARRPIVPASEDVGLSAPPAPHAAGAARPARERAGVPRARINLAQATIHLSLAPKSNAVIKAITAAAQDVRAGLTGPVPSHLRDASYRGAARLGHGQGYEYPHDSAEGVVAQQYAPDAVARREYYQPTQHGAEARYAERAERIRTILARAREADERSPTDPPST